MNLNKFSDAIVRYRIRTKLTIKEASEAAGVGRGTICRAENGESIKPDRFEKLCKWANLNPKDYIDETVD